ncbi:unnamed protein product [Caenorhabditis brenneri]
MSSNDPINSIFFEHQQAALCAQHALNMLLQDSLFTYENLRDLARQMDQLEHDILGNNANAVGRSENMNDSGYFSIQVIVKALEAFDLRLTNIEHPSMAEFKQDPLIARAYICNLREHWFVLRKFGDQWFELNSINRGPRLLSNTYVTEFMHQLSAEGYSIFVVQGILPNSEADNLISLCPVVVQPSPRKEKKPETMAQKFFNTIGRRLGGSIDVKDSQEDQDLAIAMAMSMETSNHGGGGGSMDSEDAELEAAIKMSLEVKDDSREGSVEKVVPSGGGSGSMETPILGKKSTDSSSGGSSPGAAGSTATTSFGVAPGALGSQATSPGGAASGSGSSATTSSGAAPGSSGSTGSPSGDPHKPSAEQQRRDRAAFLKRLEEKSQQKETTKKEE